MAFCHFLRSRLREGKIGPLLGFVPFFAAVLAGAGAEPGGSPRLVDRAKTAVLTPVTTGPLDSGFGGAVERVLRADLDRLKVADIAGTPALKLNDLELAVGCVGETPGCLTQIAKQLEVEALLLIHIDRSSGDTVMTVGVFDSRTGQTPRQVVRTASGQGAQNEILDQIDPMLRELYGLPPAPVEVTAIPVEKQRPTEERPNLIPYALLGVGAAGLLAGGIAEISASSARNDYAHARVTTTGEVDNAISLRGRAESRATAATVLFIAGSLGLAAGAVLFFVSTGGE